MANEKIPIRKTNLKARLNSISKWKISDEDKKDLIRFVDDLSLGKVNKGVRISEGRQVKYLTDLKVPLEFFQKPTSELCVDDVERFERALASGNDLKSVRGTPFAHSYKVDMRRLLRIYLRWKLGDTEMFRDLTDWLDTRNVVKTPDFLPERDIDKLFKSCKNASERFLIAVLFDSGARAEEFHNIRFEDVQLPRGADRFVKITLKEEYSKTHGRTISLYWKNSLEAITDYLDERVREGIRPGDPIFRKSYPSARQFLHRLGSKVLGRSIHYHLFRHSSATHYASKLNRQQLCYRYGWDFKSPMPDIYISRSGMQNKELDDRMAQNEIGDLQSKLVRQEQENTALREMQEEMRRELGEVKDLLKSWRLTGKRAVTV